MQGPHSTPYLGLLTPKLGLPTVFWSLSMGIPRPFHGLPFSVTSLIILNSFLGSRDLIMMGSLVTCSRTLGLHRSSYIIRPGRGPVVKPDFGPLLLLRVEAVQKEAVDGQGSLPQGEQRKQNRNIWNIGWLDIQSDIHQWFMTYRSPQLLMFSCFSCSTLARDHVPAKYTQDIHWFPRPMANTVVPGSWTTAYRRPSVFMQFLPKQCVHTEGFLR